jgi:hypothetical protein
MGPNKAQIWAKKIKKVGRAIPRRGTIIIIIITEVIAIIVNIII